MRHSTWACFIYLYQPVKVLRVSSSCVYYPASARGIKVHGIHTRDSVAVVTPFMLDAN
jgi:hypothetical protein